MFRNLLISALCLGSFASAQGFIPNVPTDGQPRYLNPENYTMDLHVGVAYRANPDNEFTPDYMATFEIGGCYYFTPRQGFTYSLGVYGSGNDTLADRYWFHPEGDANEYLCETVYDRSGMNLMVGYRVTNPIGRFISFTFGVKAGLDVQYLSIEERYVGEHHHGDREPDADGLRAGLAYAGYAEVGFLISQRARFVVGYQYIGSTTKPCATEQDWDQRYKYRGKDTRWHEVRLGVDVQF